MASVVFNIQGMSCAGCAQSIQRRLMSTPGVTAANVDLASTTATVTYDENIISADSLEKVIESLGFDVVYSMGRG